MEAEDKWLKLEQLLEATLRRILREELDAFSSRLLRDVLREEFSSVGFKPKTKIGFAGGKWTGVSEEMRRVLSEAYPALDLDGELSRAAAWIVANPMMAPKSQHGRFLNSWMAKAQNQASLRSIPTRQAELQPGAGRKLCAYCEKVATGSTNGIWACREHMDDALARKPRAHMLGVVAKPVAGAD